MKQKAFAVEKVKGRLNIYERMHERDSTKFGSTTVKKALAAFETCRTAACNTELQYWATFGRVQAPTDGPYSFAWTNMLCALHEWAQCVGMEEVAREMGFRDSRLKKLQRDGAKKFREFRELQFEFLEEVKASRSEGQSAGEEASIPEQEKVECDLVGAPEWSLIKKEA